MPAHTPSCQAGVFHFSSVASRNYGITSNLAANRFLPLCLLRCNNPLVWRCYSVVIVQFGAVIQQLSFSLALLFSSHRSVWRCYSAIIIQFGAVIQ